MTEIQEKVSKEINNVSAIALVFSRGGKTRRRILIALRYGPKNCNQLAIQLEVDWWTIQKHLQCLKKAGLVESTSFGHAQFYALSPKAKTILDSSIMKVEPISDLI